MQPVARLENITLRLHVGTADKVFRCAIEPAGERFLVNFAYGRHGTTLNTGTKTNVPVDYEAAKRIFAEVIKEMKGKGYCEEATPEQGLVTYT